MAAVYNPDGSQVAMSLERGDGKATSSVSVANCHSKLKCIRRLPSTCPCTRQSNWTHCIRLLNSLQCPSLSSHYASWSPSRHFPIFCLSALELLSPIGSLISLQSIFSLWHCCRRRSTLGLIRLCHGHTLSFAVPTRVNHSVLFRVEICR